MYSRDFIGYREDINMIKKRIQKKLLTTYLIAMLTISLIPIANSHTQTTDDITITLFDNTNGSFEKNEITLSSETAKNLILELMNSDITPTTFKQEMNKKLILLRENGLITPETANKITNNFNTLPKMFFRTTPLLTQGIFFDALNVFSGTFFGLKGVKDFAYLDLTLYDFPFFSGNINAGFYGWNRFTGNGTVFTAGFLGFKYLYDYNETKYDFPYFPGIRGSTLGYTGLLIYLDSINVSGTEQGPFIIGIGMSIMTLWKDYQPLTLSQDN